MPKIKYWHILNMPFLFITYFYIDINIHLKSTFLNITLMCKNLNTWPNCSLDMRKYIYENVRYPAPILSQGDSRYPFLFFSLTWDVPTSVFYYQCFFFCAGKSTVKATWFDHHIATMTPWWILQIICMNKSTAHRPPPPFRLTQWNVVKR